MTAVDHAELKRVEGEGKSPVYTAAYDTIRNGAPGLSDATCSVLAVSINMKVAIKVIAPLLSEIEGLKAALKKSNAGFEEYERKFYLATDDVDRLKLAICGGEDVPGSINAVSVEDCERFITEERGRHIDTEARISAAGVGFDGGSLTLGALERARSEYDSGFQDGRAEEFRKAQPEYDFKAEDEWFEHVLSRPDDYEGPDAGMHDTEIVENEDV